MKTKMFAIAILLFTFYSCDFRKSVNKDLVTGLVTKGDGLSSEEVYLTSGEEKINRNTFTYGEKIYLNFENVEGLNKADGSVFPGLQLLVLSQAGDTVMNYDDLYAEYPDGIKISPLLLKTYLTVANPIHSNKRYTVFVKIWDKKGKGTFTAEMDFSVIPNKDIQVESNNVSFREIYLFSKERDITLTDNRAKYNENIYMIFEGLEGFREEAGNVSIGLAMKITDSEGNFILNEDDLIGDSGIESSEVKYRISPSFIFTGSNIRNPVTCEITLWDKKSTARIKASVKMNVE